MISGESFQANSLEVHPQGAAIQRILAAAVNSVEPGVAVRRVISREGGTLLVGGDNLDLTNYRNIYLLGIGKASPAMSITMADILGETLLAGLVVCKYAPLDNIPTKFHTKLRSLEGGHPIPDEDSLRAGEEAVQFLSHLEPSDLLFCLISGGGSALVTEPVEGVTLADLQTLTAAMLACGATINEINSLRRRFDKLKGGGVARLANGAKIISLVLSDVVGNHLEAIASGPTAPDPVTRVEARAILRLYDLEGKLPNSILQSLDYLPETPKPGDALFENVQTILVGSNLVAAQGALRQAEEEGFHPYLLRTDLEGEARQAAFTLATYLRQAKKTGDPVPSPACIIAGGETTVTVTGTGKGGRNTELALAAVNELADFPGVMLVTLATDGEDGPTDAAGAVVTGDTYRRARELGMQAGEYLGRNDSYRFFEALGDLLKPGPTGTNVNDLTFLFTF
jgi:glycerate 2-kinase